MAALDFDNIAETTVVVKAIEERSSVYEENVDMYLHARTIGGDVILIGLLGSLEFAFDTRSTLPQQVNGIVEVSPSESRTVEGPCFKGFDERFV